MFLFEESLSSLYNRSESLGMPLHEFVENGTIILHQVDPAQLQPGQFAHLVSHTVEKEGARVLTIDSLNGYLNAVPEERFLLLHLHELLSYLADCVIMLRYFEANGMIRKALSVVKKRSGAHETAIRDFILRPGNGIEIGDPLEQYRGVLSGIPNYERVVEEIRKQ